jgi:hypothetical protein
MRHLIAALAALLFLVIRPVALGQTSGCGSGWVNFQTGNGVNSQPEALQLWDPDGSGPRTPIMVVGGGLTTAGGLTTRGVAAWTGRGWERLGGGVRGTVRAFAIHPSGDLIVAGEFDSAGGIAASGLARWNGFVWQPVSTGTVSGVRAVAIAPDGTCYVGGQFTSIGGIVANNIASWDGSTWRALGSGVNGAVRGIALDDSGRVFAAGNFSSAGGLQTNYVAAWTPSTGLWTAYNGFNGQYFLKVGVTKLPDGRMFVAGNEWVPPGWEGGAKGAAAVLNGDTWQGVGFEDSHSYGSSAASMSNFNGDICIAGYFYGPGGYGVARASSGSGACSAIQGSFRPANVAGAFANEIVIGGSFTTFNPLYANSSIPANNIAAQASSFNFHALSDGLDMQVRAVLRTGPREVILGGDFKYASGARLNGVCRWNAGQFLPLELGSSDPFSTVNAAAALSNGHIVVAASPRAAGLPSNPTLQMWNGSTWSTLGTLGPFSTSSLNALLTTRAGDLILGGSFSSASNVPMASIGRYSNSVFSPLGNGITGTVRSLVELPDGSIVAGGVFTSAGGISASNIAKWDGTAWNPIGTGFNREVYCVTLGPDGALWAGGAFDRPGNNTTVLRGIARWNGTNWEEVGGGFLGSVHSLCVRGSRMIAGGAFTKTGTTILNIAEWDGKAWRRTLGTLSGGSPAINQGLAVLDDNSVIAGGTFTVADDGKQSAFIGWWRECIADTNCDQVIDFFDYLDFVRLYSAGASEADVNRDGVVDMMDYLDFVQHFADAC